MGSKKKRRNPSFSYVELHIVGIVSYVIWNSGAISKMYTNPSEKLNGMEVCGEENPK